MKRVGVILLLVFAMTALVSASVEVYNHSFQTAYFPFEPISGEINISIIDEKFDSFLTSSEGDSMELGKFLDDNGVAYNCSPPDCSTGYEELSSSSDKTFSVSSVPLYAGFVITGEDAEITNLTFDIETDFASGVFQPLRIEFFENEEWQFTEFSDTFSERVPGCYDANSKVEGPKIGTSAYCEMFSLSETGAVYVGAEVTGTDDKILTMLLYPGDGGSYLGQCEFNPNDFEGCKIDSNLGEVFELGEYKVCIQADEGTDYTIYTEDVGETCGFVYSSGPESSVKDYSISARVAQYAGGGLVTSADFDFEELVRDANSLLSSRYLGDCSDSCIFPIKFSGLSQSLRISNIDLDYTINNGEFYDIDKISSLGTLPASVDYEGILDLSLTGFNVSEAVNYSLFLGGETLFEEELEMIPAPIITSISPRNPPAGIPITFYVAATFESPNVSLSYKWTFPNNTIMNTNENFVTYTFPEINNYSVLVEVSAGGNLTSRKGFVIEAVSPNEAVNASLNALRGRLDDVRASLDSFPTWYNDKLEEMIEYHKYDNELEKLEEDYNLSDTEAELLEVAEKVFSLNIPANIFIKEESGFETLTEARDIDPQIIKDFAGGSSGADMDDYVDPILRWQTQTIDSAVTTKLISVAWTDGTVNPLFRTYSYDLTSYSDKESYVVIKKPFLELFFKSNVGARKAGNDNTIVVLDAEEHKTFEFYYEDYVETPFFVAPKLGRLVIEANIDNTCNFNLVCEEEFGENPSTCRSDCKPTSRMIFYMILVVILLFIFYTILQIWYKRNYEDHLFGDRRQLYNLLMYISNSRSRGKTDSEIRKELTRQGWSSERVTYAMRKSRGQRTGMVEILPIGKISAAIRNSKAKKSGVITAPKQQMGGNINKSGFQRRPIRR